MKVSYRLCPLSPKRLAMLEEDSDLVDELAESDIPDMVDLGPEGFELDAILLFSTPRGQKTPVRDAVFAHSGRALGDAPTAKVHSPERVVEIHEALSKLPDDVIARCLEPARRAIPTLGKDPATVERFCELFERLRVAYSDAAKKSQGMLTFLV